VELGRGGPYLVFAVNSVEALTAEVEKVKKDLDVLLAEAANPEASYDGSFDKLAYSGDESVAASRSPPILDSLAARRDCDARLK
jgi:hypothetical protein